MPEFPLSLSAAARTLGISNAEASILVRGMDIPYEVKGKAFLLDAAGYAELAVAAARLRPDYAPGARESWPGTARSLADARLILARMEQGEARTKLGEIIAELEAALRRSP